MTRSLRTLALLLLIAGASDCAGYGAFRQAREEEALQHWDLAVLKYARAAELDPKSTQYKISLVRAKLKASQFHFEKGKIYRASARPELAVVELEQAVLLDPTNEYAGTELKKAQEEAAKAAAERNRQTKIEILKRKMRGARAHPPMLEPASDRPISLNFPQPKPIKQIYQSLASAAGINVIFDPQLKDENVSIVLNNVSFQNALETLMRQENHFYKVIDEKTMLIAADTPQNRRTYEDLVIRTFFLSNADVTEVANALRAILQTTRISINKSENSITLRDTADKVAIAERIVEQNDKQLAEVVIDVELLQINTTKLQDIGLLLVDSKGASAYNVAAGLAPPGGNTNFGNPVPAGSFTWDQLRQLSMRSFGFVLPNWTYSFIKNNSDAEILARPQLRISEGQKAQLVIGDRVPIPTTVFQSQFGAGGATVATPITSFQYQDVGIKIDVEPRVHHNREITLKMVLEVSQLGTPVNFGGGQQPTIGTRTISTNIRLKDGETNFLAGLYRTDKTAGSTDIPFLSDIPVLGRLFSRKTRNEQTTDLVLTLTPHIIRIPDITEADVTPVYVGTDQNISYQGTPRIESPIGMGPFDFQRGRPPVGQSTPAQPVVPAPVQMAPAGPPSSPFQPQPTPPPSPRLQVPPQPVRPNQELSAVGASPVFDFSPDVLALGPGQQRSILVRATGDTLPDSAIVIRYDPAVLSVLAVRPILDGDAVADTKLEPGRVLVSFPGGTTLSGTRAIAEVTIQGVAAGRSELSFEGAAAGGASAVVEVK